MYQTSLVGPASPLEEALLRALPAAVPVVLCPRCAEALCLSTLTDEVEVQNMVPIGETHLARTQWHNTLTIKPLTAEACCILV